MASLMGEVRRQEPKARIHGYYSGLYGCGYEEVAYERILAALEAKGSWGCNGHLAEEDLLEPRRLARERGVYIQFGGWTDRPEEWYDVARPGVDEQTGLGTWASLIRDLDKARGSRDVSIVFVDIDELTDIKRRSGRIANSIVSMVARELATARQGQNVYRYRKTGDEFVVLLERDEDPSAAARGLEHELRRLRRMRHFGAYRGATAIALQETPGETSEQLVDRASNAMLRRKVVRRSRGERASRLASRIRSLGFEYTADMDDGGL